MSFRLTLRWTQSQVSVSLINSRSLDIDCYDARRLQIAGKTRPGLASRFSPVAVELYSKFTFKSCFPRLFGMIPSDRTGTRSWAGDTRYEP